MTSWLIHQEWRDLLFAHWPVPAREVAPLIPAGLTLQEFDGSAWIGVVPFLLTGFRIRGLPPLPGLSRFLEVNVRTYVERDGVPGVWFFSLDAASTLAVRGARAAFHLPYYRSDMTCEHAGARRHYRSTRRSDPSVTFASEYGPAGQAFTAVAGSLDHFLVERYCLYAVNRRRKTDRIERTDIAHPPWRLHPAEGRVEAAALAQSNRLRLPPTPPVLHFSGFQPVKTWLPRAIPDR